MRNISYYYESREGGRMSASARHEPGPSLVNGAPLRRPPREPRPEARGWQRRSPALVRPSSQGQASARAPTSPPLGQSLATAPISPPLGQSLTTAPVSPPLRSSAAAVGLPPGRARRGAAPLAGAAAAEQRRRTWAAVLLVYALAQANLGLAWDIRWHGAVGRDDFWTAPHILIYSGVALAGLLCLGIVLATSVRYWRGDRVLDDANTVTVLGIFRTPL